MNNIRDNYDEQAQNQRNEIERRHSRTYESKAFNNWLKSVLINIYTTQMCHKIQSELDLPRGHQNSKLLHVLDIGCGRGQDIKKWSHGRVSYMVATDFSDKCIKTYEQRWENENCPYKLFTIVSDFTSPNLYGQVEHTYYDIVSAQFSFHYMFDDERKLKQGLGNILSNLLVGGVFISTVPDSYTIIKKIREKGKKQLDGSYVYSNKYFSIRFKNINFQKPYGNQYDFYLEEAVGKKNQDGTIQYTNQWLISLDHLKEELKYHGVVIEDTWNFLQFYNKYREQYKELFSRFKLSYQPGEKMEEDLWQIVHLYRVIICRKQSKGKQIHEFNLNSRVKSIRQVHEKKYDEARQRIRHSSKSYDQRGRGGDHRRGNYNNNHNYQGGHSQGNNYQNNYQESRHRSRDRNNYDKRN